ncbi:MAG: Asp-tRNA(Asn)/Glu-tRNA(Gln) amidotransferase subunit GatA [Clostridiales bacterium]|nr:Asp-tRNA(Asn)/Glu-tRNA(Gln) amidotransferase subunit GatA [Clostridiales bacterium]
MDITTLKVREMRSLLDEKKISAKELAEGFVSNIKAKDDTYKCYITTTEELALEQAEKAQKIIDSGNATALTGIPMAIKDNVCTEGILTTCASKMLENFIPPYNATIMEKLNAENFVMLGKASLDEFAMGSSTQSSVFAKTKNPYNIEKVPGGSSGGSAAALAAGFCAAAIGSDTGGSIRQPAAFCGVTGMKPTYGRVSRYGVVAFASSFDQVGALALDSHDCGIILNKLSGYDLHDGTSSKNPVPNFTDKIGKDIKGMKIAMPKEFYDDGVSKEIKASVLQAAELYKSMGAELVECSIPSVKYVIQAYYLIACAEASSNLSRFDGIRYGHRSTLGETYEEIIKHSRSEGFGDEVKRRILLGNYALSSGYYDAYYGKAMGLRQLIKQEYNNIFETCDVILTPTTETTAYNCDAKAVTDPVHMYQGDMCTVPVNVAGLPAISTPCGYDSTGLPIGMSVVGKPFDEQTIIQVADVFEKSFTRIAPKLI